MSAIPAFGKVQAGAVLERNYRPIVLLLTPPSGKIIETHMAQSLSWDGSNQLVYSPVSSDIGPSLSVYNGRVYATWIGSGGDQQVYYASFDGQFWSPQKPLKDGRSSVGPSLVVFHGSLWAVTKASGDDQRIWFASYDGESWGRWRSTDRNTSIGGALAVFHGSVYMAYNGMRGDEGIFYTTFDGSAWPAPKKVPEPASSNARPALATWSDGSSKGQKLVLAWKESGEEETLWFSTFDGSIWTQQQPIPQAASAYGPALTYFRGVIYAAWRGPGEDERIWCSSYNGTSWTEPSPLPSNFTTSLAPSLVVFQDQLYAAFKGPQGDNRIWWTRASPITMDMSSSVATEKTAMSQGGYIGSTPIQTAVHTSDTRMHQLIQHPCPSEMLTLPLEVQRRPRRASPFPKRPPIATTLV